MTMNAFSTQVDNPSNFSATYSKPLNPTTSTYSHSKTCHQMRLFKYQITNSKTTRVSLLWAYVFIDFYFSLIKISNLAYCHSVNQIFLIFTPLFYSAQIPWFTFHVTLLPRINTFCTSYFFTSTWQNPIVDEYNSMALFCWHGSEYSRGNHKRADGNTVNL